MANRSVHLVGSTPFTDAAEALDVFATELGPRLRNVPDGETGDRQNWIQGLIESFRQHPDLELTKDGTFTDYDDVTTFRVRKGRSFTGDSLDLGYFRHFDESWPAFEARRDRFANGGSPRFQIGIPGDLNMSVFTFGNPLAGFRRRRAFTDATLRDIRAIHERVGDAVVYQQEVPFEQVGVTMAPGFAQGLGSRILARGLTRLAAKAPEGTRWGIHLCLGDLAHRSLGHLKDATPIVRLANAIARGWPAGRPLDFIHAPLAEAVEPPPMEPEFYAPLRGLRLPPETRFIAGFVHEGRTLEENLRLLEIVEGYVGQPVDVATSCGLGRRSREGALATIELARALADA